MMWIRAIPKSGNISFLQFLALTSTFVILQANKTVLEECNSDQWDCDSGGCIYKKYLCDGEVNCEDGSDEIAEHCIAFSCTEFQFRCLYGGCISGHEQCNGVSNCADNSDELPHLCAKNMELEQLGQFMGDCGDSHFKCQTSGECIESKHKCDGRAHCNDGSDETVQLCSTTSCPEFSFKCDYGACIDIRDRCNGNDDCFDGSDESSMLCYRNRRRRMVGNITGSSTAVPPATILLPPLNPPISTTPETPTTLSPMETTQNICQLPIDPGSFVSAFLCDTNRNFVIPSNSLLPPLLPSNSTTSTTSTTTTTSRPPTQTQTTQNTCQLPIDPSMIITDFSGKSLQMGSVVSANALVKFQCQPGYTLSGFLANFCMDSKWSYPLPTCRNYCSTVELTGLSTSVTCELNGGKVHCDTTVPPRTVARINCAIGFSPQSDMENTRLRCESNGEWNFKRPKCRMQCGKVAPPTTKFVRGGRPTSILEVPWHVGIYSNFKDTFEHICGGTIISPRLVISAAHCFWNDALPGLYDKNYYKVVAGKTIRDYAKEQDQYQASALTGIIIENQYTDRAGSYRNDIAVLRLETALKFSASVSPVCIRFERNAYKEVETGATGKFAGWGITENNTASSELQSVTMSAISNTDCRRELQQYGNYNLPDDKFCLKDEYGKSACRGDSGGGYVRALNYEGKVTHYLIGVISHAPAKDQDCAVDGIVALTNVNYFEYLIEDLRDDDILGF